MSGDPTVEILLRVVFVLGGVVLLGRSIAWILRPLGQPPVIGEILAGILLGPSLLGPELAARILPAPAVAPLETIAELGVVLFMFLTGLELDFASVRARARVAVTISYAGILVPLVLGVLLAIGLFPRLASTGVSLPVFAAFVGVAMSITAFPVLARILTDRGLERTPLGTLALSVAAIEDVTAWCLLAVVLGIAGAEPEASARVVGGAIAFVALMVLVARPLLLRFSWVRADRPSGGGIALAVVALFAAAFLADRIGIHAIFGAFLLGAILPHESGLARFFARRTKFFVAMFLLPAFFALTGMRTRFDLLSGVEAWALCALVVLVATAGKLGGVYAAARATGVGPSQAAALGALMNARGLMELVVLNVGLEAGIVSPPLFAMLVVMAIATTASTGPALSLLLRRRSLAAARESDGRVL